MGSHSKIYLFYMSLGSYFYIIKKYFLIKKDWFFLLRAFVSLYQYHTHPNWGENIENFVQKLFILILHDLDRGLCFAKLFCFENPASEVASLAQHRMTETCFLLRCVTRPVWTDLAKFLNFGNFSKFLANIWGFNYLLFCKFSIL